MEYSYKFRLYPTQVQQEQIVRNFGCCRYVFNHFLAERQEQYKETGVALTRFQQDKHLTALKQELPWLKEVDSTFLQAMLQDLDRAFQNFFRRIKQGEKFGYPRFKSKHNHRQSYKSKCVGMNIQVMDNSVQLPKLGRVKCRISKEVKGRILSDTVSRNPCGKYFVALCCTDVELEALPSTRATLERRLSQPFFSSCFLLMYFRIGFTARKLLLNCSGVECLCRLCGLLCSLPKQ